MSGTTLVVCALLVIVLSIRVSTVSLWALVNGHVYVCRTSIVEYTYLDIAHTLVAAEH